MMAVLCTVSILIGLWLAFLNWRCFYLAFIKKTYSSSWIPLLAASLLFVGIYFYPNNPMQNLAWLTFFADWGSVPGIGHAIYFHWKESRD